MSTTESQTQCPFINGGTPKTPAVIQATGKASREQKPDQGCLRVSIGQEAATSEEAWTKFQDLVKKLQAAIGVTASIGTIEPVETSETVSTVLRGHRDVLSVTAEVKINFSVENLGAVIAALVENSFVYSNISFTYSDKIEITPDLLEEASKNARDIAEAIARGAGQIIGRLVSIHIGNIDVNKNFGRNVLDERYDSMQIRAVEFQSFVIDPTLFDVKMSSLKAHVVVAHVTATFEIVE